MNLLTDLLHVKLCRSVNYCGISYGCLEQRVLPGVELLAGGALIGNWVKFPSVVLNCACVSVYH